MFIEERSREYLINHYKLNVEIQPENYYFSLLLLFKPWRDTDELNNGCDTYAEAFASLRSELPEALEYHERMSNIQKASDHIKEQVQKIKSDEIGEEDIDEPSECVSEEANDG